ncbi:MAG TPA: ribosome-associated translation inhibitor RaiA [Candidatus Polarisedimenticolaceae bacterium]
MRMNIVGRHVEVTPALKRFAMEKLGKLDKLIDGPLEAHVVLAVEKHRHLAEIQVKSKVGIFSGSKETADLYASIGDVVDKITAQAHRQKEKLQERKRRTGKKAAEAVAAIVEAPAEKPARRKAKAAKVVRIPRYRLKPLSADDAASELEATGSEVLVFRDADTYRVNVVFRRADGAIGLVDPEF